MPQYGDENDELALKQIQQMFLEREVVGVYTREMVYGGGISTVLHSINQR